ncbi:MAG TPA: aspartate--tRNA ligase [Candidatus Wolfebacteria bacterium]|nr:aspartate--tRNA ligase [Candidatus Wolfebacteria bacterium]
MRTLVKDIINKEGEKVELAGWVAVRRDHGKVIFIDLRDRSGIVQMVFTPSNKKLYEVVEQLRPEWVIKVIGKVSRRPEKMKNPNIETGEFEIQAEGLEILNLAETPPLAVDTDGYEIGEDVRMKYRYLDLRRPRLQKNLKLRANIIKFIRDFLIDKEFIEVETPVLGKSTPEGARDYLVPSRLQSGKFYALPQSPQQYKQLLMVAGLERYFQIVKCFRDEDTRGDRQPEFTQLDIEMSFTNQEEILKLVEDLYVEAVKKFMPEKKIKEIPFPRISYKEAMEKYGNDRPDLREDKNNKSELAFAFVVDFPMFEWREEEKRWDAVHHPFTKPKVEKIEELKDDPSKVGAYQYDLVLNGEEIGGGSIRSHDPEILKAVFEIMGHSKENINKQFGHLMEAFKYGTPPHGGIALGLDRLLAVLLDEPNIREVIAFPKTGDGRDLMMQAPSEVDEKQLNELNIKINKK